MVDFLVIGPRSAYAYKNIFILIKDEKITVGYNRKSMYFDNNDIGVICRWFSNISDYCPPKLELKKHYNEIDYDRFDNYDCINIDSISDIPSDYDGLMGVPISFLDKWNPEQFELVYASDYIDDVLFSNRSCMLLNCNGGEAAAVDGKKKFHRILIKKK